MILFFCQYEVDIVSSSLARVDEPRVIESGGRLCNKVERDILWVWQFMPCTASESR